MAKKKKNRKPNNLNRQINKVIPGFWIRFSMADPIGDHDKPQNVRVGHKNPVIGFKLKDDGYWDAMRQILHHKPFKWRMEISMEFYKDSKTEFKTRELVGVGKLPNLDEHYLQVIEDMFQDATDKNYIDQYIETHVTQEVISGFTINNDDFSD